MEELLDKIQKLDNYLDSIDYGCYKISHDDFIIARELCIEIRKLAELLTHNASR